MTFVFLMELKIITAGKIDGSGGSYKMLYNLCNFIENHLKFLYRIVSCFFLYNTCVYVCVYVRARVYTHACWYMHEEARDQPWVLFSWYNPHCCLFGAESFTGLELIRLTKLPDRSFFLCFFSARIISMHSYTKCFYMNSGGPLQELILNSKHFTNWTICPVLKQILKHVLKHVILKAIIRHTQIQKWTFQGKITHCHLHNSHINYLSEVIIFRGLIRNEFMEWVLKCRVIDKVNLFHIDPWNRTSYHIRRYSLVWDV